MWGQYTSHISRASESLNPDSVQADRQFSIFTATCHVDVLKNCDIVVVCSSID